MVTEEVGGKIFQEIKEESAQQETPEQDAEFHRALGKSLLLIDQDQSFFTEINWGWIIAILVIIILTNIQLQPVIFNDPELLLDSFALIFLAIS